MILIACFASIPFITNPPRIESEYEEKILYIHNFMEGITEADMLRFSRYYLVSHRIEIDEYEFEKAYSKLIEEMK